MKHSLMRLAAAPLCLLAFAGCNNPGGATSSQQPGAAVGVAVDATMHRSDPQTPAATEHVAELDSWAPLAPTPGVVPHPPASQAVLAPFGTSTTCGDAIVGLDSAGKQEECDDGTGTALDACTPQCQTRDQPAAAGPKTDRAQGAGRHPIAGLDTGFINTYIEFPTDEAAIGATLFNVWGQPQHHVNVSDGASPIDEANPVAAALPNGAYAVAWGDFDSDGSDLGVALRKVQGDGGVGPLGVANGGHEFSQLNPDMVWTGSQLVVAWEDYADAANGPDLRYRLFDADLNPLSDDTALAASALPEAAVALTAFNDGWAASYREGTVDGKENVVVWAANKTFRLGPVLGGPLDDRPALVALDATRLLLVFSAGTDPNATGVYNVPRLRYSIIDTTSALAPTFQSLDPLNDLLTSNTQIAQLSPSAAQGPDPGTDGVYVAWRSEGRPGDAAGDQIWLKYLSWTATLESKLSLGEPERLIPRVAESTIGDQRRPELANVALPPSGAVAIAWDDYSHSQGSDAGDPDVAVHYAPLHSRASSPTVVTESWTGADGAPWPAQWTVVPTAFTTTPVAIQANEGRVIWPTGSGSAVCYINNHTALDVDMLTKVRFNINGSGAGFIARYVDVNPVPPATSSYIYGHVGTTINDTWSIIASINGTAITIAPGQSMGLGSPGAIFTNWGQQVDFLMRFRVTTNANQSITVGLKLWVSDVPEPTGWTMQGTTSDSRILTKLGATPGRFGLVSVEAQGGRSTTYDNFRATFYEGAVHGDPTVSPSFTPLERSDALYRDCTPDHQCALKDGACLHDTDCVPGASCQSTQSEQFGLGSSVPACSAAHCADRSRNADEPRADCGGADCKACTCTLALAPGTAGYCTPTNGCLCGIGEGHCTNTNQCMPGLICRGVGIMYNAAAGVTVCAPGHCFNRVIDSNIDSPETGPDCGGECGSCSCGAANGSALHCRIYCPCASGNGTCQYNDECQPGLICGSTKTGARFGLPANTNACVKPHCNNNIKDATETGIDCGDTDCGTCP
jgi:hypothetical protein